MVGFPVGRGSGALRTRKQTERVGLGRERTRARGRVRDCGREEAIGGEIDGAEDDVLGGTARRSVTTKQRESGEGLAGAARAVCGRGGLCLALVVGPLAVRDDERRSTATASDAPFRPAFFLLRLWKLSSRHRAAGANGAKKRSEEKAKTRHFFPGRTKEASHDIGPPLCFF